MSTFSLFYTVGFMRFISILSLCVVELTLLLAQSSSALFFALSLRMDVALLIIMSTYFCTQYINFKPQQPIEKSAFHVLQSEAAIKLSIQLYRISPDVYSRLLLLLIGILKLWINYLHEDTSLSSACLLYFNSHFNRGTMQFLKNIWSFINLLFNLYFGVALPLPSIYHL